MNTNQAICFLFVLLLGVIKVQANNQNLQQKTLVVFSLLEEGEQNNKIKKIHNKLTSFGSPRGPKWAKGAPGAP